MSSAAPTLLWFRRDLRLADNPALTAAASEGPVIPIYILADGQGERALGGASLWWLDKSLRALAADLEARGSRLVLRRGDPLEVLPRLAKETGARRVRAGALVGGPEFVLEGRMRETLARAGVEFALHPGTLLTAPGEVATGAGRPYQVFTPFFRALRAAYRPPRAAPAPPRLAAPPSWPASEVLEGWGLHPTKPDWSTGFNVFTPGEAGARAALELFLSERLAAYAADRDRPDRTGTSRLSPHLHWGEIPPAAAWSAALRAAEAAEGRLDRGLDVFLSELGWREFNHHLLAGRPDLEAENFHSAFDAFPWRRDARQLEAWRRGRTGYPLVDAGLRELWTTGWMHNRIRMVVGSFLVKHLLIHWREGEAWFWDTLLDASPANNSLNWQWVAGSGADAAPFFRIFNPTSQAERYDPDGAYIRRWVPEIGRLQGKDLRAPWLAPPERLRAAGVRLGADYPRPLVDHAEARARALAAYAEMRARAGATTPSEPPRAEGARS